MVTETPTASVPRANSARPRLSLIVLQILLIAAAIPAAVRSYRATSTPRFLRKQIQTSVDTGPVYRVEFLPSTATHFVHGASITELPNGSLLAAWYGGSDETNTDVAIFTSTLARDSATWSPALAIVNRDALRHDLRMHVKSVGNPVVFVDGQNIKLFYAAVIFGGWSGSTICMNTSPDGVRWSPAKHVMTSPFLNFGMLVKGEPIAYEDGSFALPVYHQFLRKRAAVVRLDGEGTVVDETRIDDPGPLIQPWIVPLGRDRAVAFLRWSSQIPGSVMLVRTEDAGQHWSPVVKSTLIHRDSAVTGVRLTDGSLLAIYNNTVWGRRDLSMARSTDEGVHWSSPHFIEHDTESSQLRHEYSYPFLFRSRDGLIHLVYTWQRTRIRHVVFNDAWVVADPILGQPRR